MPKKIIHIVLGFKNAYLLFSIIFCCLPCMYLWYWRMQQCNKQKYFIEYLRRAKGQWKYFDDIKNIFRECLVPVLLLNMGGSRAREQRGVELVLADRWDELRLVSCNEKYLNSWNNLVIHQKKSTTRRQSSNMYCFLARPYSKDVNFDNVWYGTCMVCRNKENQLLSLLYGLAPMSLPTQKCGTKSM